MQLVERFKKLRQWQQQQQENLLRQQRQQLEAVKLGQNKLQGILAVQKLLYEQTGAEQGSPAPKQASRAAGSFGSDPNTEQEAAWQRAVSSLPSNQSALSSGTQNQMNASSSFHAPNRAVESGHAMYSDSVVWQQLGHCAPSELPAPIMNRSAAMPGHLLIEKTSVALGEAGYPRPQLSTNLQPSLGVPDLGGMSPAAPGVATGATQVRIIQGSEQLGLAVSEIVAEKTVFVRDQSHEIALCTVSAGHCCRQSGPCYVCG